MSVVADLDRIDTEGDAGGYRELSGLAVVGVVLGGLSCLALENVAFGFIPAIGIGVNWRALRRIAHLQPALSGRSLALAGLALSLIFGLSSPLIYLGNEKANRAHAIEVARGWFGALRDNRPEVAHQWMVPRWMRVKDGDSIPSQYATESGKLVMGNFLEMPAVRTLLNLGKSAHVRYVRNVSSRSEEEERTIVDLYAVTVRADQETVSFFLQLTVKSRLDKMFKSWSWELNKCEFLSQPPDDGLTLADERPIAGKAI